MNNLLEKMKKIKKDYLFSKRYFKSLNKEEIFYILNLNNQDFKDYLKIIDILYKKNILTDINIENITKKVLYIAFSNNNQNAKEDYFELITTTNFLQSKNILQATIDFLNIKSTIIRGYIIDLFESYDRIYNINANKIIFNIKNMSNEKQVEVLFNLFIDRKTLINKNLNIIINMIKNNPNFKYYNYFISLIVEHDIINIKYLENFFLIKNKEQAKVYYNTLINSLIMNSIIKEKFLELILDYKNKDNFEYFNILVLNKDKLDNHIFNKLIDAIINAKTSFQKKGIIDLLNTDLLNDDIKTNLIIKGILNSQTDFQIKYLLKIMYHDYIFKDLVFCNYFISIISLTKKEYQLACLFRCLRKIINSIDYITIINEILNANEIVCQNIPKLFQNQYVFSNIKFLNIYLKFVKLKTINQIELFLHILNQENILDYDISILDKINSLNNYQCEFVFQLFDIEFYKHKYYKLIKYIFLFKDLKHIKLFYLIILHIDNIGYDKALELINNILKTQIDLDIMYNYILSKINDKTYELERINDFFNQEEIKKEILKIKTNF